jgi:hypothetical protein
MTINVQFVIITFVQAKLPDRTLAYLHPGEMTMNSPSSTTIGQIAIVLSIVAILGLIFITLFYTLDNGIAGPFGTLNDICVALGGVLSGGLILKLYPVHRNYAPRMSRLSLGSGLIGAFLAPVGSCLAIFNVTGWFLAGLVTTFGYAFIGLWLLGVNLSARGWYAFPRRLAQFGILTGGVMVVGLLVFPGILSRSDVADSAQWFSLAGLFLGGLGWNILYTTWCVWLGRLLLSNRLVLQLSSTAEQIQPHLAVSPTD